MWIRCLNPATAGLYNEDLMDEKIEFSDNGTANVPRDVGKVLIENYGNIVEYNK